MLQVMPPPPSPVSGFYAECASRNMYLSGHLWTRSKFLGLSLGVHNIGTGWLPASVGAGDLIEFSG